jgi:hypothetical protein
MARKDPRYVVWLKIADELDALHEFIYSDLGPFPKQSPLRPTGKEAADWLRQKCSTGRWYWWDKTTVADKAKEPLRIIMRVVGDSGGLYEETEAGQKMLAEIKSLHEQISLASV